MYKNNILLHQNPLTDDAVLELEQGYYYKNHNKSTVKLVYYTYANEWGDKEHVKFFKSIDTAIEWYKKNFRDRAIEQGKFWLLENGYSLNNDFTDDDCLNEWESLTFDCAC